MPEFKKTLMRIDHDFPDWPCMLVAAITCAGIAHILAGIVAR